MSGLHTRDLEIPSVMGVSVYQGVTATANEMDVTDGGLGQHQRGWRTVVQSQHERGCSEARRVDEWRPFQKRKWLLPIPIEHRTRAI